jgi:hypothetical protein
MQRVQARKTNGFRLFGLLNISGTDGLGLPPDDAIPRPKQKAMLRMVEIVRDMEVGDDLVAFINRNVTPYPTEVGAPAFDLIPIEKQKDIMVNVARMHGQQEYDRIMALVAVLQQQAESVRRRLKLPIGCMRPSTVSRSIMDSATGWHTTYAMVEPF